MKLQITDKVKVKYVEHKQYNYLVGEIGVVEEIDAVSWVGKDNVTVYFPQFHSRIGARMGWGRKQLEKVS